MLDAPHEKEFLKMPRLSSSQHLERREIVIHMHLYLPNADWYLAEYDPDEGVFYGFVILDRLLSYGYWAYECLDDLLEYHTRAGVEVSRDVSWSARKAGDVQRIVDVLRRSLLGHV